MQCTLFAGTWPQPSSYYYWTYCMLSVSSLKWMDVAVHHCLLDCIIASILVCRWVEVSFNKKTIPSHNELSRLLPVTNATKTTPQKQRDRFLYSRRKPLASAITVPFPVKVVTIFCLILASKFSFHSGHLSWFKKHKGHAVKTAVQSMFSFHCI